MNFTKATLILITFFSLNKLQAQSPWAKEKGKGFSQLAFTTIPKYNLLFQSDGSLAKTERFVTDNTIQSFNEIGIANNMSVLLVVPFKMQSTSEVSNPEDLTVWTKEGNISGLSNVSIGLRKGFDLGDWVAAVQVKYDFKSGSYDELSGLRTAYDCATFNGLYSIGKGFSDKSYFFVYTGGSFRTNNYSDQIIFGAEYGHKYFDQLWVIPFVDFNFSLRNGETSAPTKQNLNGFYVNNQEYTAFGLKLIEELNENIGITAGFGGAFTGHNVASSPAFSIGAYYKW